MKGDCEGCKKPATVHLTEISNGKQIEKHYCESCPKLQNEQIVAKPHMPINQLLENFVLAHAPGAKDQAGACESCSITWADFKQAGLLGCENDYVMFEKELQPIIQRAHEGATHHIGKVPTRKAAGQLAKGKRPDVSRLRKQLADAIEREDYELAAKLRDQIKQAGA
jgi:protein arginine kinase activator